MKQFDDEGLAIPGSYAIAVVEISGSLIDGSPVAFIQSAICDECGSWASDLLVSGETTTADDDDITKRRISRQTQVIVYTCQDHREKLTSALVDEFGHASNFYRPNELANAVHRAAYPDRDTSS